MVQNPHCAWGEVAWVPGGGGEASSLGATPFMPGHHAGGIAPIEARHAGDTPTECF